MNQTTLTPISGETIKPVEWLIPSLVPIGKLTVVSGQMGQAKSLLTIRWAADVTKAGGQVLMFAVEDDDADTILPRLAAAGADTDRVYIRRDEWLDHEQINEYCDQLGNVRLVTVDPLTAFFNSQTDAWNTPKVRRFLRPLIEAANRHRFALVGILHTNRWSDSTDPLSKIAEAQGIPQVARSVLILGTDPLDPDGRVLATAKNNLARGEYSSAFKIQDRKVSEDVTAPLLVPNGESFTTARDLLGGTGQELPAVEFLREALADGPRVVSDLEQRAKERDITAKMLRTAATHLDVLKQRHGFGSAGYSEWSLKVAPAPF